MNYEGVQVTVICLVYNQEKYIKKCLDSILRQKTNFKFEIIVNDDASTDSTVDILKDYSKKYNDILRVFYHNENQYSKGKSLIPPLIEKSKGNLIAFCEGDDFFNDDYKLQKQYDFLKNNKDYVAYAHSVWKVDETGEKKIGLRKPKISKEKLYTEDVINNTLENYSLNSLMVRKEAIYPLPDFYYYSSVGDIPLSLAISLKGCIYYKDFPMASYRVGAKNSWNQINKKNRFRVINYYKSLKRTFKEFDSFTNKKYHTVVLKKMEALDFWESYWKKPKIIFFNKNYFLFYLKLDFKTKLKLLIKAIFLHNIEY